MLHAAVIFSVKCYACMHMYLINTFQTVSINQLQCVTNTHCTMQMCLFSLSLYTEIYNDCLLSVIFLNGKCVLYTKFSLFFSLSQGLFSINGTSGELRTLTSPLNVSTFAIFLGVEEDLTMTTTSMTVTVTDENSPPLFDKNQYQVNKTSMLPW